MCFILFLLGDFLDFFSESGVGGEASGEAKAGAEVCMDGEEHRAGS